jgi:hypothetical protein
MYTEALPSVRRRPKLFYYKYLSPCFEKTERAETISVRAFVRFISSYPNE